MNFLILFIIVINVVLVCLILRHNIINSYKDKGISFKESLDLTDLPIITVYQGSKRFNFLIDTGATKSIFDSNQIDSLITYKDTDDISYVMGIEGNKSIVRNISISFYRNELKFNSIFQAVDMSKAFKNIKQETGVSLQGILGNDFFVKYKYVIDFKEFVAYIKK